MRQGQAFDLERMLATWVGLGYESAAVVEAPGQFSRRGGIVDIWPPNLRKPLRIELFGDEIDSLRTFDPSTQRTLARVAAGLDRPGERGAAQARRARRRDASRELRPGGVPSARAHRVRARDRAACVTGSGFRNLEWYIPYLYSQPGSPGRLPAGP